MAYDEALADRIRERPLARADVSERKMFGGVAFMVAGNMACGVLGEDLIVRLGERKPRRRSTKTAFDRSTSPAGR